MIFAADMVDEILAGRKTVTRRQYKGVECRYVPGRTYAVQPGRGKAEVARIRIVDVDLQVLGHIDNNDAKREGFPDKGAFMSYWRHLYHGQFFRGQLVWRIEFELLPARSSEGEAANRG